MKLLRRLALATSILVLVTAAWIWWNRPQKVDMAAYAPADSLVFLEANSPLDIAEAVLNTDAWKSLSPLREVSNAWPSRWLRRVVYWTGLGPLRTVILARSQVAIIALDLGATEQGETLKFKPESAILIETHTGERRIRPIIEESLQRFAEQMYRQPKLQKYNVSGSEFIVWSSPAGDRQIFATIIESLVIVGNSESAVKACADVRRGQRPNLRNDPELQRMRENLQATQALTFGFIPSSNAERLFSLAVPVIFGRAPGHVRFNRLLAPATPKVVTGVGWTSQSSVGGIEDRYLILLQPAFISRLRPVFRLTDTGSEALEFLPDDFHSATFYRFDSPIAAWQVLESSVSAQLDTLAAVVFGSLLRASLVGYGIDDPDKFLGVIGPGPATIRLTQASERSVLIAKVADEEALRKLLGISTRSSNTSSPPTEPIEIPGKPTAAGFLRGTVLLGRVDDVRGCMQTAERSPAEAIHERLVRVEHFLRLPDSAGVVTYSNDFDRVMAFVVGIARATGRTAPDPTSTDLRSQIGKLPYAATQTTLTDHGLERRTRSSLGLFSTLLPLLFPNQ